ncbi:iron-containing redox enzyme family protein [Microbispora sp. NPDC049125]|uniref:iron-containing redox enzyme family protein n=1 Tax=Microbispora sp. NPDC049125 TaxID=3154929 RepID=UPI003465728B
MPAPRGPITAWLLRELKQPPHPLGPPPFTPDDRRLTDTRPGHSRLDVHELHLSGLDVAELGNPGLAEAELDDSCPDDSQLDDEDLQLALFACYELHYQGLDGVDDRWEWSPWLLGLRGRLEERLERALARAVPRPPAPEPRDMHRALADLVASYDGGPSLSAFLRGKADLGRFREFVVHRSIYHLKEADPHTWAIPRLLGRPKAALVEIQADEYGGGRPGRMHSELFAATMRGLDLDDAYGGYVDSVPAITLAVSNTMSLFGLHRRHRGALVGHLAAFEMTSSQPNRRYSQGLRRLGGDAASRRYYDEHVQADAVHEQIAAHDMCGGLAAEAPHLAGDIMYGAGCALTLDRLFAEHVLGRWRKGASSLRDAGVAAATVP